MSDFDALETSDDFGKVSKINSAGLVNQTLNDLWKDYFRHYRSGQYLAANSDLDCIWTILGGEKVKKEKKEDDKKPITPHAEYAGIEKKIIASGRLRDSFEVRGFGKISKEQLDKASQQKILLQEKALFLRTLQNKQGKGTAYLDEDEGDFD